MKEEILFRWYMFTTALKSAMGRLYVFRDKPDWFVNYVCDLATLGDAFEPDTRRYFQQALAEQRTRKVKKEYEQRRTEQDQSS